jgi:hypothetical protein
MLEIRFDKTKGEVALLIWFLVDHSVLFLKDGCFSLKRLQCLLQHVGKNKEHTVAAEMQNILPTVS